MNLYFDAYCVKAVFFHLSFSEWHIGRLTFSKAFPKAFLVCVSISRFIDPSPNKGAWVL